MTELGVLRTLQTGLEELERAQVNSKVTELSFQLPLETQRCYGLLWGQQNRYPR